jgi:hypothetical protein
MGIAVRNEGSNVNSNINVTPMVDVMLVLLIIFMVITPMLQNKVQIDMAKVDNPTNMPDADKEDAIVVAITRDGGVFLGQNKVATQRARRPGARQAGRQAGQDHLRSRRCARAVQGGGRRHRRRAYGGRGRRGPADAKEGRPRRAGGE